MKLFAVAFILWQLLCPFPTSNGASSSCEPRIFWWLFLGARNQHESLLNEDNQTTACQPNLRDTWSMLDLHGLDKGANWTSEDLQKFYQISESPSICSKSGTYKQKILSGIQKGLQFYESHMDVMPRNVNSGFALSFLKAVDDKHGKRFQNSFPISNWTQSVCNSVKTPEEKEICGKVSNTWKPLEGRTWKAAGVVKSNAGNQASVGYEKEHFWSRLNDECQLALVNDCQVPYVCEKTLYDPVPKSQYFLSHQLLQRIFTEQSDCPAGKNLLSEDVNDQLCSKMYQEAMFISQMEYPHILRDLFGEYVALCGHMRYPNFFREDWMDALLSWQSESDYGCFRHEKEYKSYFTSSDSPILRKSTAEETHKGLVSDEQCLPHFTSVGLAALATSWDYMEENCP